VPPEGDGRVVSSAPKPYRAASLVRPNQRLAWAFRNTCRPSASTSPPAPITREKAATSPRASSAASTVQP
jgi:hypothetical protein